MRIRTRQGALAAVLMLTCIAEMYWVAAHGVADYRAVGVWSIFSMGGLVLFFGLIRSGVSLRWQDPSMAFVQMLYAVACNAVAFVIAGHARGVTLPLLSVILMFGIFGMSIRQLALVAVYSVGLFSAAIAYELTYPSTDEEPVVFGAYLVMVLIVLSGSTYLTWRLTQIREHVRSQKKQLTEALEKIQQIAIRDELTSAVNRRHMQELLRVEVQRSVRIASPLLIAVLDIDHFKRINDSYGHQAGDRALQAFVEVVQAGIRGTDTLARWGGEEFLVMLTDAPMELGAVCMSRVRTQVQDMLVSYNGIDIRFTVSIGLTQYRPGESVAKTIGRADEALYAAKAQGRNQVVCL
ncbi:diguanylate cyclase [Rhodoferax sp. OV413]|uniref:GGDEF domain-containing protein n=1 Tax=Rhodoferax sp. OV413 TaxID=1855285 RepID=UPI00115FEFCF|nr:diguanylate cyclase [Rhodoferax sp. OV413]